MDATKDISVKLTAGELAALKLTGLDAQNPLAFFCALGLLRVLDDDARARALAPPRLRFVDEGYLVPILDHDAALSWDDLVAVVLTDAQRQSESCALRIAYNDAGERVAPEASDAVRDLKPPPALARMFLEEGAEAFSATGERRAVDLLAGFFSELVQDHNGNTKPTTLHFTAGQQVFLGMIESLRANVNAADLREALLGPWENKSDDRKLPSLSWDASASRAYALRASDPSKEKKGTVAGANWLAVQALGFFPVSAQRGRLVTTCIKGGWKDSVFTWPIWGAPATAPVVASLLRLDPLAWSAAERAALGVIAVCRASIQRSDQGGYGSFSPAGLAYRRENKRAR